MADKNTTLTIAPRPVEGSRSTRRLRREGFVPGVLYGGGADSVPFQVEARELRHALHASGAVIELTLGDDTTPALLKDRQRHPVRGETTHVDFLRVDLTKTIEAVVTLEAIGGEDSPGIRDGGVVDQPLREIRIQALPNAIPESVTIDVSQANIGDTFTLAHVKLPDGVTLVDELDTPAVSMLAPRLRADEEEEGIETETEVVGEAASGDADDDDGGE